jgi:nucleotide-binding universal stress UspA family protein
VKSILVDATNDEHCDGRLQAAIAVSKAFGSHITCLQLTNFEAYAVGDSVSGFAPMPEIAEIVAADERKQRSASEAQLADANVQWTWANGVGQTPEIVIEQARLKDLVILSTRAMRGHVGHSSIAFAGDVATNARGPAMLIPADLSEFDPIGTAAIAWNGSIECSHALKMSLPLLKNAKAVHILTVGDEEGLAFPTECAAEYLGRHGLNAQIHSAARAEKSIAAALLQAAASIDAAYMVAGAFGHSRFRESVLGGVTRELLYESRLPLVLAH